jgi:hypothetical protein
MVPFPEPKPDKTTAYKLAYAKPSNVNVVGSYPLKTMERADSTMVIDMVVTIPESILQEKDYLNYRYFYKRAYYVACIAAGLQNEEEESFDLSMENLHGNDLQPVLVVKPGKGKPPSPAALIKCPTDTKQVVSQRNSPNLVARYALFLPALRGSLLIANCTQRRIPSGRKLGQLARPLHQPLPHFTMQLCKLNATTRLI